ncbi:MAG: hypothetical protein RL398_1012, partial [Planctomycetota bacterium]
LSAAEQAQLSGSGMAVETIEVMAMTTPMIMVQAPLTPITGTGMMGPRVRLMGMGSPMHGKPMLMGNGQSTVLSLRTHRVDVMGLQIDGGQVGVDVRQMPMGMAMMEMAMLMDCDLQGQTAAGVRLHGMGNDESMLMTMRSTFANMPVAYRLEDQTTGTGLLMSEAEFVTMTNVGVGADVQDDGSGLMSMWMLFRSSFQGETLCKLRRAPSSANQFMFRIVHSDAACSGDVTDVQGNTAGLTMFHHHHGDFVAAPGRKAFWVYPRTAVFDVHGSEMVFEGDVSIAGNAFSPRTWQQNNVYKNGAVTYDCDGALPNLLWNTYENVQFSVPASARSPVRIRQSELYNTTVDGQSLLATTSVLGSYRQGGAVTGLATESSPAPNRFLGHTNVGPAQPQIGTTMQLQADMPFGVGAFWDFAWSYSRPTTTAEPVRFYGDPASAVILPGMVVFTSNTNVPLPNNGALVGMELYVQAVTIPLLGQSWMPAFHLPRGQLVRPRM